MTKTIAVALLGLLICAGASLAQQAENGSREEAMEMVKRVQEMFASQGSEATFAAINDPSTPEFHDRDLYPFVYDMQGVSIAHGARPVLIGKNLISLKDQGGKYLIREMIEIVNGPGTGWIDYKWPHPTTDKIEDKSSYVEKMGDYFVGVGIYKD